MGFTTYKQYDSRWGNLNYNGSSTMAMAGCGPTACATIISGFKPKITPLNTMKYMQEHGYAIRNQGTAWAGIPACLKHYGLKDVHEITSMADLWKTLEKSKNYKGIIRFKAGSRGGVTWTTEGHFVAFTAYKKENGKHYLWMRDPGPRNKTKWYCYEDTMKGLVGSVWVGKIPVTQEMKLDMIADMAEKCAWKFGTKKSKYKYPTGKRKKAYVKALNKAYPNRSGWRRQTRMGASCDVFVGTVVRASGVDKKFPRGCDDILEYMKTSHAKKRWKSVKVSSWKNIPRGAITFQIKKSGAKHITVKLKGNRLANAHYVGKTYPIIQKAYGKGGKLWGKDNCKTAKVYVPK